jgi:tripeptidyl-peptidase I
MSSLRIVLVSALLVFATAAPSSIKHVIHEERPRPSLEWVKSTRIEGSAVIPIRIGLNQNNLHRGQEFLSMSVDLLL